MSWTFTASQRKLSRSSPQVEVAADQLGTLIDADHLRIRQSRADPLKCRGRSSARQLKRRSIAGEKHEKVLTTTKTWILRSDASWSWTKSVAQTSFGRVASARCSRSFASPRRLGFLFRSSRISRRMSWAAPACSRQAWLRRGSARRRVRSQSPVRGMLPRADCGWRKLLAWDLQRSLTATLPACTGRADAGLKMQAELWRRCLAYPSGLVYQSPAAATYR